MASIAAIFITGMFCFTVIVLAIGFSDEIENYIDAKADQIRTKTAMLKEKRNTVTDERDTEVFGKEGTE